MARKKLSGIVPPIGTPLTSDERGVRVIGRGIWYISAAHSDADIVQALAAAGDALRSMNS